MQATVHRFDDQTGDGSVLLDTGEELAFTGEVFDRSGLRHVRVGQRLSVVAEAGTLTRLWIRGIGADERIG
ncbi:MAG TPA: hypothetical protein VFJ97_01795 [Dermatophilaceae bacterium]|nr:hypothetical protein [Dermatophilaceae bacterium]